MKKILLLLAGISTAAGLVLVSRSRADQRPGIRPAGRPVDQMATNLRQAWSDHHTVA